MAWRKHTGKMVDKGVYGSRPDNYDPFTGNTILRSRVVPTLKNERYNGWDIYFERQRNGSILMIASKPYHENEKLVAYFHSKKSAFEAMKKKLR